MLKTLEHYSKFTLQPIQLQQQSKVSTLPEYLPDKTKTKEELVGRQFYVYLNVTLSACLFVLYLCSLKKDQGSPATNISARFNDLFTTRWIQHIQAHPIKPSDRNGFAEMGLRARVYAQLLRQPNSPFISGVEENLWPFAPGAAQLRHNLFSDTAVPTRGLVFSLGRNDFRFALHFMNILRTVHKSDIPVEIYYYGEDDLPLPMREYLEKAYDGLRCVDLETLGLFDPSSARLSRQGWALKPFAMLATNFTEVILADADVIFLADPNAFFDEKGYKETGTLFFHDRDHYREGASKIVHEFLDNQLGARGASQRLAKSKFWSKKGIYEQESGVVLLDKQNPSVFSALLFTAWQNTGSIRQRTTYRVFWGEKESYWLAFELAGFPHHFVRDYAGGFGITSSIKGDYRVCSSHPMHFLSGPTENSVGRPAWFNGGLLQDKRKSDTEFLNTTTWATDAEWHFLEETEEWCMQDAKFQGTLIDSNLFSKFLRVAKEADAEFTKKNMY